MRFWYRVRAGYRHLRVLRAVTRVFGAQYVRSRDRIEIDITYACNLRCLNCNRSITQAPDKMHMSRAMIQDFVAESIARGKRWSTIRILGGEPTMHPECIRILEDVLQYKRWHPACQVQLVTNGNGKGVQAMLKKIPSGIEIENSAKTGNLQPSFGPFNLAPADDPAYRHADYRNGCAVMSECGMALTPLGYYPCAVAGGIDRIEGNRLGHAHLPADDDDMLEAAERLCRLCGHFREGHFIPEHLRPPTLEQKLSPTWVGLYQRWREDKKARRMDDASRQTEYQLRFQRMPVAPVREQEVES
ncbi:hypothetical protein NCCP691_40210 [Noviherbaspirillum aridicola]|uniref:Radical SAM core domain-containing protein n=2 Tax=Noviherbaspirillum aridicola TaxID=2849687 RepID=A0ABQ4QAU2_9BURK|nr:hypothetical protein NCCP691_40210 [Noviherbaspirillum aridicola]